MPENLKKICRVDQLKNNQGQRFIIDQTEIAVFKIGNEIFAINNICPHQHTALLYDGFIEDGYVVCPAHGWKFNLKTGKQPTGRNGVKTFPVVINDNEVFVEINQNDFNW
jgi:NAD(P)H-dependent nitrite reductase small subunit